LPRAGTVRSSGCRVEGAETVGRSGRAGDQSFPVEWWFVPIASEMLRMPATAATAQSGGIRKELSSTELWTP
jgi:hypothetical protein